MGRRLSADPAPSAERRQPSAPAPPGGKLVQTPDAQPLPSTRQGPEAVRQERGACELGVVPGKPAEFPTARHVPQPESAVGAGPEDPPAVWRESHPSHVLRVPEQAAHFAARLHIPEPDRGIPAAGQGKPAVGRKRHGLHLGQVPVEPADLPPLRQVVHADRAVEPPRPTLGNPETATAGQAQFPVQGERNAEDLALSGEAAELLAGEAVPEPDREVATVRVLLRRVPRGRQNVPAVGRKGDAPNPGFPWVTWYLPSEALTLTT